MWYYNDKEFTSDMIDGNVGFVYLIENLIDGRKYVGKKIFQFKKKRQVNKKKKRYLAESDWKDYYGSSETLSADVEKFGKENFRRTILHLCRSKKVMTYRELEEQMKRRVLEDPMYYNTNILGRFFVKDVTKQLFPQQNIVEGGTISKGIPKRKKQPKQPRKLSEEHKLKISASNTGKKCPWNNAVHKGNSYGKGRKGNGLEGMAWYTNGLVNRRVNDEEGVKLLQQGFKLGRTISS